MILEIDGVAIEGKADLINAVRARRPGDTVHLKVLRQGKAITVPVVLDARPADAVGLGAAGQIEAMRDSRQAQADKYWDATFAPLLRGPATKPAGQ
jgi:PDZ domain-containing secreted protein